MDISVIIPIYNVGAYIKQCLDSVEKGIRKIDGEVLLIDDGSTDKSSEIAQTYAATHQKFQYFRKENGGVGSARNAGVLYAKGEYILFVDPDDVIVEEIWEKMLQSARRFETDLTICDVAKLQNGKIIGSDLHLCAFYNMKGVVTHVKKHPNLVFDSMVWNKLIRREFYLKNQISFPEGTWFEDIPVAFQLHYHANAVAVVHETGYLWRAREHSITRSYHQQGLQDKIDMLTYLFHYVDQHVPEDEVRCAIEKKVVKVDFTGFINHFQEMDRKNAENFMEQISSFVEAHVRDDVLNGISLFQRQTFRYMLDRDLASLNRLIRYKFGNDSAMPIIHTDQGREYKVREEYFTVAGREIYNNYKDLPPRCMIESAHITGKKLSLAGYIYMRKVDILRGEQTISAYLLDDITGDIKEIQADSIESKSLTEAQGRILNHDDYEYYDYCYDGAGFQVDIDLDDIREKQKEAEFYLFLCYNNPVYQGERILRGAKKVAKDQLKECRWEEDGFIGFISFDKRDTFSLRIRKKRMEPEKNTSLTSKVWRKIRKRNL